MNDQITKQLDDAIEKRLSEFDYYDLDSDNIETAVETIEKLYKLRIDELKVTEELEEKRRVRENDAILREKELDEKRIARENEEKLKEKELRERKIDRWFGGIMTAATTAASLIFYGIWMNRGFKFEETGTFTSATFKGLFNRFRPMK